MGQFQVNPDAEVSQFNPVKAGTYRMKVLKHEEKESQAGNKYFKWQLGFIDPADSLLGIDGAPLKGAPSSIFLNTMLAPDLQWKLRALVEAALGSWRDFEPTELYGKEVECAVTEREYEGNISNEISRVIIPRA